MPPIHTLHIESLRARVRPLNSDRYLPPHNTSTTLSLYPEKSTRRSISSRSLRSRLRFLRLPIAHFATHSPHQASQAITGCSPGYRRQTPFLTGFPGSRIAYILHPAHCSGSGSRRFIGRSFLYHTPTVLLVAHVVPWIVPAAIPGTHDEILLSPFLTGFPGSRIAYILHPAHCSGSGSRRFIGRSFLYHTPTVLLVAHVVPWIVPAAIPGTHDEILLSPFPPSLHPQSSPIRLAQGPRLPDDRSRIAYAYRRDDEIGTVEMSG